MRYIIKRGTDGEWEVFDVRRQKNFSNGLTLDEARETAGRKNKENDEDVKQFLDDNLLPR